MPVKYDVVATVGKYEKDGETKYKSRNVGAVIETKHGPRIKLDASFSPAGCPRDDDEWKQAVADYRIKADREKQAAEAAKAAKNRLIELADGQATEGDGAKVTPFERSGSVDWKAFITDKGLDESEAEAYRKAPSSGWRVTI